ncbi:MAG: response regulator transcription factor, partial [Chloroflexi bacterium]|nr:response regulator transcription factor [Chloroflexota bacterium]
QAGARGYLLKGAPREELFTALRVVHQGGSSLEPAIASKLLARVGQLQGDAEGLEALTEREMEVLQLMAQGASNRDIADRLFITERTVKFHVAAIFQKLEAHSRTEALAKAVQRGLVHL